MNSKLNLNASIQTLFVKILSHDYCITLQYLINIQSTRPESGTLSLFMTSPVKHSFLKERIKELFLFL